MPWLQMSASAITLEFPIVGFAPFPFSMRWHGLLEHSYIGIAGWARYSFRVIKV